MTILYGISNCDTIKKAQHWLTKNDHPFTFYDYRKMGVSTDLIETFLKHLPVSQLLNKRSTTYRKLSYQQKQNITNKTAVLLFIEFPTLIKRPLLIHNETYLLGFKESDYQAIFV